MPIKRVVSGQVNPSSKANDKKNFDIQPSRRSLSSGNISSKANSNASRTPSPATSTPPHSDQTGSKQLKKDSNGDLSDVETSSTGSTASNMSSNETKEPVQRPAPTARKSRLFSWLRSADSESSSGVDTGSASSYRRFSDSSESDTDTELQRTTTQHSYTSRGSKVSRLSKRSETSRGSRGSRKLRSRALRDSRASSLSQDYSDSESVPESDFSSTNSENSDLSNEVELGSMGEICKDSNLGQISSRDFDRFRRHFPSNLIPANEPLLKVYSCALSKEILFQGKMYVTPNNLCFYAHLFNIVQRIVIPFTSITKIEPRMTITFIPNAIGVYTYSARYTFASLSNRNRTIQFLKKIRNVPHNKANKSLKFDHKSASDTSLVSIANKRNSTVIGIGPHEPGLSSTNNNNQSGSTSFGANTAPQTSVTIASADRNSSPGPKDRDPASPKRLKSSLSIARGNSNNPPEGRIEFSSDCKFDKFATRKRASSTPASDFNQRSPPEAESSSESSSDDQPKAKPVASKRKSKQQSMARNKSNSNASAASAASAASGASTASADMPALKPNEKELVNETLQASTDKVAELLFGNDTTWIRQFIVEKEKNRDLEKVPAFDKLEVQGKRYYEYTKPLNGPVGPKQTRCKCTEQIDKYDLKGLIEVTTVTQTPDVPSGNSFTTITRVVLAAQGTQTQIRLGTWLEWTGKSWLKGPIEKGAIDGQTSYCKNLVSELRDSLGDSSLDSESSAEEELRDLEKPVQPPRKMRAHKSAAAEKAAKSLQEWQYLCVGLSIAVIVLLVLILVLVFKFRQQSFAEHTDHAELSRIEQELNLWKWIDDRNHQQVYAKQATSNLDVAEAIAQSELKLANLKAALGN